MPGHPLQSSWLCPHCPAAPIPASQSPGFLPGLTPGCVYFPPSACGVETNSNEEKKEEEEEDEGGKHSPSGSGHGYHGESHATEAVSRAGPKDHIPGLRFGALSTPSNARGVPVRVSCPGLEMPFPKAGWACLWGNFYLHKQPLGGQQGCGSVRVCPYRQPRSEGNVNTDGRGGNAAAQRHPHCDGVLQHPVLLGAGVGSPGLHGRGGVQRRLGMSHTDRR